MRKYMHMTYEYENEYVYEYTYMSVYVCVYVCMYVMYVCMYVRMYVCMYVCNPFLGVRLNPKPRTAGRRVATQFGGDPRPALCWLLKHKQQLASSPHTQIRAGGRAFPHWAPALGCSCSFAYQKLQSSGKTNARVPRHL